MSCLIELKQKLESIQQEDKDFFINVPFNEKEQAKTIGARWNPDAKSWYMPAGSDLTCFLTLPHYDWLPESLTPNYKANSYYIASTTASCWKCNAATTVYAIMLPPEFLERDIGDEPDEDEWETFPEMCILSHVSNLPDSAAQIINKLSGNQYRIDYSKSSGSKYWMNHCETCGTKQGDYELINEADTPFTPICPDHTEYITLFHIKEPIELHSGGAKTGIHQTGYNIQTFALEDAS